MAIIKCPECHNEVSDMAPSCPHCGVKIDGNIVICPDCGKVLLKKEIKCPNCGCPLAGKVRPVTSVVQEEADFPEYKHHRKRPSGKFWGVILIILLVIALLAGCYYVINLYRQTEKMEESYALLENNNNKSDFKSFLENFPLSPYTDEIKERLSVLEQIEQKWISISDSTNREYFEQFLSDYPHSFYDSICRRKLDSLDWVIACEDNSADGYQHYIDIHPDGLYKDSCALAKENIDKTTASYTERSAVRDVLSAYFEAVSANSSDGVQQYTNERVYGQTLEFMHQLHGAYSRVYFGIENTPSVSRAPLTDSTYNYVAKFRLSRVLTTSSGETLNEAYNASYMLNKDKRIISMYMNKSRVMNTTEEP